MAYHGGSIRTQEAEFGHLHIFMLIACVSKKNNDFLSKRQQNNAYNYFSELLSSLLRGDDMECAYCHE